MKKVLITISLIIVIILAVPLIGNKVIESTIDNRIEVLTSYGLEVKDHKTSSSYLKTKKEYIFVVQDTKKFVNYLNQFADTQLPPYVDALVDGAQVGFDLEYSNIPLEDKISIDIYPYALSSQMAQDIQADDAKFYTYVSSLLENKALSYHLNYDVVNADFDGYIKDIDEKFTLEDGSKLSLKLQDATFSGSGMIVAPDTLGSNIKELVLNIKTLDESMNIEIKKFKSSSVFESSTTYATTGTFGTITWDMKNTKDADINLLINNLALDFSSNTQSAKADFFSKLSFDNMDIKTSTTEIYTKKFNYDIALRGVSKDSYEKLMDLLNRAKLKQTSELEAQIEETMFELLARGMVLDIADLSLEKIATAKTKDLGGMSLKSKITLKQDRDLASKLKSNPSSLMEIIDMDLLFKISKNMYSKLALASPLIGMAQNFAKEENNLVVFDIKLKDSQFSVNERAVK